MARLSQCFLYSKQVFQIHWKFWSMIIPSSGWYMSTVWRLIKFKIWHPSRTVNWPCFKQKEFQKLNWVLEWVLEIYTLQTVQVRNLLGLDEGCYSLGLYYPLPVVSCTLTFIQIAAWEPFSTSKNFIFSFSFAASEILCNEFLWCSS